MTDIRDLILDVNSTEDSEKTAEEQNTRSSVEGHIKVAEQLEALSEEDTLVDDLIKVALFNEATKALETEEAENDN